jgi:hypothetical protein
MKTKIASILLACLALTPAIHAADKHDHSHEKKEAGPNGGRIVASVEPHYEFFVTPERKVKITFLTEDNKATALKEQTVTATSGERSAPIKMTFTKEGDSLVSDKALPEGNNNPPIILQVKTTPDAKSVTEKFNVNLADCSECKHKEYACTCAHEH